VNWQRSDYLDEPFTLRKSPMVGIFREGSHEMSKKYVLCISENDEPGPIKVNDRIV